MADKLFAITFRYRDAYTDGKWLEQDCVCSSVEECKRFYGLGIDCDYQILDVVEVHKLGGGEQ